MGEKCKAAQVKLDDKSVDVKYFQEENWDESSGESSKSNSSSQQLIAKPESKTHLCKQACWEAYFPYNELESVCYEALMGEGSECLQNGFEFCAEIKSISEEYASVQTYSES